MNQRLRGTDSVVPLKRKLDMVRTMIRDEAETGRFHVDRKVFTDREIHELEMRHIFEATWNFVGLESQIPEPDDYVTAHIGRQPVILQRGTDGVVRCFYNTCRHRGAVLCPYKGGNKRVHVCRYHAWSYDSTGRCLAVAQEKDGQYPEDFDKADYPLMEIARMESYRGFVFGSLNPDVPPLKEHLGDAARFLDLTVDQGPEGVEYVPGEVAYTYDGNWKLQWENGLDFYHFAATHAAYMEVMKHRQKIGSMEAGKTYEAEDVEEGTGTYAFDRGHALMYAIRKTGRVHVRPIAKDPAVLDEIRERVGEDDLKWILRQRNLTIFPNLQVVDISAMQLRTWRPLGPGKTEMRSHCLAPIGEGAEARELRIRNYEDFFNPTGLGASDDNLMYEYVQAGYEAEDAGATSGYLRGLGSDPAGPDPYVGELRIDPAEARHGPVSFGDESCFHTGYREWLRLIEKGLEREAAAMEVSDA
ncbi:Rieske 2Fe-2S domain-containing protein [Aquicoccus sp. SCR17]|nr:Rieske 2Fe-2S domain-containing protein [Carideicomes alvinocaridis]